MKAIAAIFILSTVILLVYIINLRGDIRTIKESIREIKAKDTNMRLVTSTFNSEIVDLANEINELIDNQKQNQLEVRRANQEFRQGITNISHDLRTPLTSATGYIGLIKSDKVTNDKKMEYLNIVESRLNSLSTLMTSLFDYTQLIEGKAEFKIEKINLNKLLTEEIASFYHSLTQAGFEVDIKIPEQPVFIYVDEFQLKRVIQNLISNTVKHGTQLFKLEVAKDGSIYFINKIPRTETIEVDRLFERFYIADYARTSQKTGLGLTIVKTILEKMNGSITAQLKNDLLIMTVKLGGKS